MAKGSVASEQLKALKHLRQSPAAVMLGRSSRYLRDMDAPRNPDGSYDATKLVRWFVARETVKAGNAEILNDLERKTKAEADLKEIAVFKERGLWVDREAALRAVKRGILESRGILEVLKANIMTNVGDGGEFNRETIAKIIDGEVQRALRALREGERIGAE